ncbi:MAG: EAL domain-containing protein, partial [Planctomycetales bacterium]|nr:EAL domain-containing protein [Planctomycetales bacterium]
LARWRTSSGEYIPPSDFIPVAEQTGLILPLGEVVFQLAAEQACRWFRQGIAPHIAVNVSPHQLRHPRYIEQLDDVLKQTGASADWFELEITEYAMMDDVVHAVSVIETLSARGFRVAIDDFGTGYSSLSYIKSFPIHTLKIDLSFVRDVTHDFQSNAIVRSIVSLGTGLGLTIVAEGVETAEQASVLTEAGVSILQGYYIGKPMSAQQYESWLEEQVGKTWPFVVQ